MRGILEKGSWIFSRIFVLIIVIFCLARNVSAARRKKCRREVIAFEGHTVAKDTTPHFEKLKGCTFLDLMATNVGDEGILQISSAIKSNRLELIKLKTLHVPENGLTDASVTELARAIASTPAKMQHIRELYLQRNQIGDMSGVALGIMLKTASVLELLSLNGNKEFSDEGAAGLSAGIANNRNLEKLFLSMTSVSDVGAKALADALNTEKGSVSQLQTLNLSHLSGVGLAAATALAEAIGTGALQILRLDSTGIGADGATALFRALQSQRCALKHLQMNQIGHLADTHAAAALAAAMGSNERLENLQLRGSRLGDGGLELLARALATNARRSRLTHLDLGHSAISDMGARAVAAAVVEAQQPAISLHFLGLQGNALTAAGIDALSSAVTAKDVRLESNPGIATVQGRAAAARLQGKPQPVDSSEKRIKTEL